MRGGAGHRAQVAPAGTRYHKLLLTQGPVSRLVDVCDTPAVAHQLDAGCATRPFASAQTVRLRGPIPRTDLRGACVSRIPMALVVWLVASAAHAQAASTPVPPAREVAIGGDEFAPVLYGQGCDVRVGHQRAQRLKAPTPLTRPGGSSDTKRRPGRGRLDARAHSRRHEPDAPHAEVSGPRRPVEGPRRARLEPPAAGPDGAMIRAVNGTWHFITAADQVRVFTQAMG